MIVPDCLAFFILSQYPLRGVNAVLQQSRDYHMGKIQWIVNQLTKRHVFDNEQVVAVEQYMHAHPQVTFLQLLEE